MNIDRLRQFFVSESGSMPVELMDSERAPKAFKNELYANALGLNTAALGTVSLVELIDGGISNYASIPALALTGFNVIRGVQIYRQSSRSGQPNYSPWRNRL